jgi:hypothetical protein
VERAAAVASHKEALTKNRTIGDTISLKHPAGNPGSTLSPAEIDFFCSKAEIKPQRHRGRPRKDGSRGPNGRLRYQALLDQGHDYTHQRRIDAGAEQNDPRAATPLGMMAILGLIDEALHIAGEAYEATRERLHGCIGGPGRTRSALAQFLADVSPACRDLDEQSFAAQEHRLDKMAREAWARMRDPKLMQDVLYYHRAPLFLTQATPGKTEEAALRERLSGQAFHQLQTVQHDLEELRKLYKIPKRDER